MVTKNAPQRQRAPILLPRPEIYKKPDDDEVRKIRGFSWYAKRGKTPCKLLWYVSAFSNIARSFRFASAKVRRKSDTAKHAHRKNYVKSEIFGIYIIYSRARIYA